MHRRTATLVTLLAVPLLLAHCRSVRKHTSFGVGVGPAVEVQQTLTSSVVSRASGGCYADCKMGMRCNQSSGVCEDIPDAGANLQLWLPSPAAAPKR